MTQNHIQDQIEAARLLAQANASAAAAATAAAAAAADTAVATVTPGANQVALPTAGKKVTMEDLMVGQMAVDGWMKVSFDGIKVGESKFIDEAGFTAIIDAREGVGYTPQLSIKYGQSPVSYLKTYDQVTASNGKSWPDELVRIGQQFPTARPYPSADVVAMLVNDTGTLKAGQNVGYALATTSFKHFANFLREVEAAGLKGERVLVQISCIPKEGKGNKWGEVKYTLIGPADAGGEE